MNREAFKAYLFETNTKGSRKASSYIRAIDLLEWMLQKEAYSFEDCIDIWNIRSAERLHQLYNFVLNEAKRGADSPWHLPESSSYLKNGYCSAALKLLTIFLIECQHRETLLKRFLNHTGAESEVVKKLNHELALPRFIEVELEGKEAVRDVKVRVNQNVFREIILRIYKNRCCITGLDIPIVNRASHIIGWAENKSTRMDPRNGLCLSATYDAAFDQKFISLDDDYRIILSKELKEYYTSESVKRYFVSKAGDQIHLPQCYLPKKEYLEAHRNKGVF